MSGHVVVVGGGVIGAACAHFLNRAGWTVTVVDQGRFGRGCSHGNCGYVSPSHVLPLAGPGALWSTFKTLMQRNSPLAVNPFVGRSLWSWLWRFARRCNERDMTRAAGGIQTLLNSSRSLYEQIIRDERLECEWQTKGLLFVFKTKKALEHFGHTVDLLSRDYAMPADRVEGEALTALEPALKPGLAGAYWYRGDAHLRPDRLMSAWRANLEERGVRVVEGERIVGLLKADSLGSPRKIRSLMTDKNQEIVADAFVLATGAWTPALNKELGCRIPIQPGKGYSVTMPRPERCPVYPLLFEEDRVAVTPMSSGYRLGSMMEFVGYDTSLKRSRLKVLYDGAARYLHTPASAGEVEEWFGWRPMTPDGLPVIDRAPGLSNVVIAAGHNMLGLSMAPATGKLVAELLAGEATHLDTGAYGVGRFG